MATLRADRLNQGSRKRRQLLYSRSGKNEDRVSSTEVGYKGTRKCVNSPHSPKMSKIDEGRG